MLEVKCKRRGNHGMWHITVMRGESGFSVMAMNDQECNALLTIIEGILDVVAEKDFTFTGEFPASPEEAQ